MKAEFHYNIIESCWNPAWWSGEPVHTFLVLRLIVTSHILFSDVGNGRKSRARHRESDVVSCPLIHTV